jgi:hypothetical protein
MHKRWLSQLLDDSAFPLLVLALALSQVNLGSQKKSDFFDRGRHPPEPRLDDRLSKHVERYSSSNPSGSAWVAETPVSAKE